SPVTPVSRPTGLGRVPEPATKNASQSLAPTAPVATLSLPPGWQQYSYAEDRFSISAPSNPDFKNVPQGHMENHNYTINLDGNRSVLISFTDTKQRDKLQAKPALSAGRDAFAKNLNLKIAWEKEITLGAYSGIEFEGQSEQWRMR